MISRKLVAAVILLAVLGAWPRASRSFAAIQENTEWQRYKVEEEFSVLLPHLPAMTTESTYVDPNHSRRERVIGAYADGIVYVIYTFEKKGVVIDDLTGRFARQFGATPGEPVRINGISGSTSAFSNSDRFGKAYFFATKKNLYVFEAVGSTLGNASPGVSKFFSSIKFDKKPEGARLFDGAGDPPNSAGGQTSQDATPLTSKQAVVKATVITKPEPSYTEAARQSQITGTVVLRVVFSSSGAVDRITVLRGLSQGLTERAIGAARQIRFIPAAKDGHFVSMWMQLEYNFNLY